MRRIWAYILTALTALILVGTTFVGQITKVNSNIQFENGREIVFHVNDHDDDEKEFTDKTAIEGLADIMAKRLEKAKVSSYEVLTSGYDTVKVRLSQATSSDYQNIVTYLTFNGNLGLTWGGDTNALTADEFLLDGKDASIDSYNGYPAILLPVNTDEVDKLCQFARDDTDNKYAESSSSSDSEEATYTHYLYLWYDYVEDCDFEAATDSENEFNKRLLMKFEVSSDSAKQYYDDSDDNRLYTMINLDANSDNEASVLEKTNAYNNARFFVNLINAGPIEVDGQTLKVTYMYEEKIDASIASILNFDRVSWNSVMVATLTTIILLALLLIVFYRLGALTISTITISSVYIGLLSTLWFSAEFSVFGLFALVAVAVASLASGAIYMAKLKGECYRGRNLRKANAEASKKSLLPIVDVNLVVIVIGVFCYIFGGITMRAFGAITVIGGLVSLLLNTLGLKGMMWLATNASSVIGKYELFGISPERVPDVTKEEKQTYFGAYAEKDLTKKHKLVGIIVSLLFVACVAGSVTFASLNNNNAFVNTRDTYSSEIYFETTTDNSALKESVVTSILSHTYLYVKQADGSYVEGTSPLCVVDEKGEYTSDSLVSDIYIPKDNYTETVDGVTVTYYYYIAKLNVVLSDDVLGFYDDGVVSKKITSFDSGDNLNTMLSEALTALNLDENASISLKAIDEVQTSYLSFGWIALALGCSITVMGIYFMLRYRLSRGLACFTVSTAVSGVVLGILSLCRLPVSSLVLSAVPVVAAFTMIIAVVIMNRERELILEDKMHDNSIENRRALSVKGTSLAFTCVSAIGIFVGWIALGFFGFGPVETSWSFALLFVGIAFATWVVTVLLAPTSSFFYKLLKNMAVSRKPRKEKKHKTTRSSKSAEPEEAIFIGIND